MKLNATDQLTESIKSKGILDWESLAAYIQNLPYGRNTNRYDNTLVWFEQKGTCSSKHAFLKLIADLNKLEMVRLILVIFKMNAFNTPEIQNILDVNNLDYIPEAHCFLSVEGRDYDYTTIKASLENIKSDIVYREVISPGKVKSYKVNLHKSYIQNWIVENEIPYSLNDIWQIREKCIKTMS